MAQEIELKLTINPKDIQKFEALDCFLNVEYQQQELTNTYFDTPDLKLHKARSAVRIRSKNAKDNKHYEMTLKAGGGVKNGMHTRNEWNFDLSSNKLDVEKLFECTSLKGLIDLSEAESLMPIFSTDFKRKTWLVDFDGAKIEVALDQGAVCSGAHQEPICEVELELIKGDESALLAFRKELLSVDLKPFDLSKAQRGYALYSLKD